MFLFFKMRKIRDLDVEEQEEFIEEYISHICHLDKAGIKFKKFIHHAGKDTLMSGKTFAVGCYEIGKKAKIQDIETKISIYSLHEHFLIIGLL